MQRVEKYVLTKSKHKSEYFELVQLCHKTKNLYNYVTYILRQCNTGKLENIPEFKDIVKTQKKIVKSNKDGAEREYEQSFIAEYDLSKRLCSLRQDDYVALKAQVSQQVIALVFKNFKSYYKTIADYYKHPNKYHSRPAMPKYKDKDGLSIATFTNQAASIDKNGNIKLVKDFVLNSVIASIQRKNFRQVRIIPRLDYFQIEIVYEKERGEYTTQAIEKNKKKYTAAIDIGVDNLATITSDNEGLAPLIVNGRALKSVNQYYNKIAAELNKIYSKQKIHTGKKLKKLNMKRNFIIEDFMHKASRRVVDFCIINDIGKIVIGHNAGWKQKCIMSKKNNQNFVQIPFNKFINMIKYKCEEVEIEVDLHEEAYTSKCSALDNEEICKHEVYLGKRVKRGLFMTEEGKMLNADVNGSYNILRLGQNKNVIIKKAFNPRKLRNINELCDVAYFKWQPTDRGQVFQPFRLITVKELN